MSRDWQSTGGKVVLAHWFFTRGECDSRDSVAMFGDIYGRHSSWGEGVASSGQRPGMLLSVLQSTGQSPHRIHEAPNVSRSKVKKPCFPFPFYILVNCFSILDSSHNQLPQQFLENF